MSDTAYMIIIAFIGLYFGVMLGLYFSTSKAPAAPEAEKQAPRLQPLPLAPIPVERPYVIEISLN
jgi:hypothetical protein